MGRKRNQGKARRAAKATKAREEAKERGDDQTANSGPSLEARLRQLVRQLQIDEETCAHGAEGDVSTDDSVVQFINAFRKSFDEAVRCGDRNVSQCLVTAQDATWDEISDNNVWGDAAKLEFALSYYLFVGTQQCLDGNCDEARVNATFARFFEQRIAVHLEQSQALPNWPKIFETYDGDDHTIVKFFRRRIPCSCLDKKYEEVKHITKLGFCFSPQCSISDTNVERSKAKYCSRCRCVTYCSLECQEAHWSDHKPDCDNLVAMITKFEAERQE